MRTVPDKEGELLGTKVVHYDTAQREEGVGGEEKRWKLSCVDLVTPGPTSHPAVMPSPCLPAARVLTTPAG